MIMILSRDNSDVAPICAGLTMDGPGRGDRDVARCPLGTPGGCRTSYPLTSVEKAIATEANQRRGITDQVPAPVGKELQQFAVVEGAIAAAIDQICQPNSQWFWGQVAGEPGDVTAVLRVNGFLERVSLMGHEVVGLAGQRHVAQYRAKGGTPNVSRIEMSATVTISSMRLKPENAKHPVSALIFVGRPVCISTCHQAR